MMSDDVHEAGERQAMRSTSFGAVATDYERFRPGPPIEMIDWMLPAGASTVVDLGAGTGAMTKDLVARIERVIAVEPDDRMRGVLAEHLPEVEAVRGVGESMPLGDASVDAVLASSSWHWMDSDQALREAARVLVPSGTLAVVWTGPDPDGPFVTQAQALLSEMSSGDAASDGVDSPPADLGATVVDSAHRVEPVLHIPRDSPFAQPERRELTWDVALTADELIGLLGTFSWIITMSEERRARVIEVARQVLRDALGVSGDATVQVQYRCEAWRTRLTETIE
jgi:SAM-dependent methyltransferase